MQVDLIDLAPQVLALVDESPDAGEEGCDAQDTVIAGRSEPG